MTIETFLVNSIEDRYGEEMGAAVEKGIQLWAEKKKPDGDSEFDKILEHYVYPYVAAAEVLLSKGVGAEEIKALVSELIKQGSPQSME